MTPEETLRGAQHQGEPTPVSESALEAAKRIMDANPDLVGLAVELDAFAAAAEREIGKAAVYDMWQACWLIADDSNLTAKDVSVQIKTLQPSMLP
jgi:hypothetical protein